MPYFVTAQGEVDGCAGYAVVKEDGEAIGCHTSREDAILQMVAVSLAEGIEPGGQRNTSVPEYIRSAAARGLTLRSEGFGGSGLTEGTIREARAMARGEITDSKIVRANAWAARHAVDLERPQNSNSRHEDWPGPGAVAHYLWGINPLNPGPARRWFERKAADVQEDRQLPDNYRPALSDDVPEGRACGNCLFYDESNIQGDRAWCQRWEDYVRGDHYCNAWQSKDDTAASSGERMTMDNVEIRTFDAAVCEMRATEDGDGMTFGGYAWRYMEPSLPLPFTERIAPGAFTRTLKSKNDIRAYVNHDDTRLLGSTRAKTLKIEDRAEGGWVELSLPPTTDGEMVRALVSRGDIQGMSFGFSTVRDSWSEDGSERTLEEVRLHEVSVVTGVPAYPSTSASVRNLRVIAKRTDTDVDQLAEAISALEAGQISDDQADILRKVVDRAAGVDEPTASDSTPISLLMKQLDLLGKTL